jgi:methylated-DNA-[protein]-cysteine S-methyltransferase
MSGKKKITISMLVAKGLTPFQIDVLTATMKIPKGQTRSYKEVAIMAGHPNAYRAVGTTMKRNPFAPTIPCHRVIKSNGSPGNYSSGGSKRKIEMLKKEGAM